MITNLYVKKLYDVPRTLKPDAYSEPCQTSKMEQFVKIVSGLKLKAVNYF